MNYFQELTIIKSSDVSPYFIWSKLYAQVHLALVKHAKARYGEDAKYGDIGVSFPEYRCFIKNDETIAILGGKLRVFGKTQADLEQLNLYRWCTRLLDYVHIKSIDGVGNKATGNLLVKRFRQEKSMDSKTLNFAKKHGKTFEEVKASRIQHIAHKYGLILEEAAKLYEQPKLKKRPYIRMKSGNNGNSFSLEIDQSNAPEAVAGTFNTYGMSATATVPHW